MKESVTIPKQVSTKNDLDFGFLRELGLEHLESLGSKIWTDYNTHDPGITIMEMLCYAITDLSQRIEMPIENLLASETENFKQMHQQFVSAVNILPSKPVTALDYRKLFVHIKEVKNAWIVKHEQQIFLNCENHQMSYTAFKIDKKDQKDFTLKGLNDIYIDFEDEVEDKEAVFEKVKQLYHKNRNLCEDLVNVCEIPEQHISVCAYLDISPDADEERIQALIIRAIGHYLAPSVSFYSLKQMYDKGYTTDQIFEGPIPFEKGCVEPEDFQGGFIDTEELRNASLRQEIRLSDMIQIIMNIEGVLTIKDISMKTCDDDEANKDPWIICVKENHKPVLCWDEDDENCKDCSNSIFNFSKGFLPIGVNKKRVVKILEALHQEEQEQLTDIKTEDVTFPLGKFSNAKAYTSIQEDFPETYGISSNGLQANADKARKAKAKQLKAYLLFFDQILANYFSHLSKVKDLLSIDESLKKLYSVHAISELSKEDKQTYFTQTVNDITGIDELVDTGNYEDDLIKIVNNLKSDAPNAADDTFYERRNQLLDHLISRFAERFSDYAFIMKMIYGDANAKYQILKAKTKFVEDYKTISCERGIGFNYCDSKVWDTENVSGAQKRIARLTGISDFSRRNLLNDAIEIYDEKDKTEDNLTEYRWRIKDGTKILLSSSKHYHVLRDALKELFLSFELAKNRDNYDLKKTKTGRTYFNIINPKITDKKDEDYIVARRIAYTATQEKSEQKRDEIIAYLKDLSAYEEGMYLIEHLLLRPDTYNAASADKKRKTPKNQLPDAPPETFMPSCLDGDCKSCGPLDPYSFRVSVILPGWPNRFSNKDFRNYMEKIIREEIPAHVLARICWIGHVKGVKPDDENDMLQMQLKYRMFLEQLHIKCVNHPLSEAEITSYRTVLSDFIPSFNSIHTIYDSGNLHDCDNDDTETKGNKIILGRTNIGNL
ncbi:hypothetical protein [Algibacter sp. 2305UL17-15]|uniref:hypothetical protein n=1 Tax=Algibacter sp. 2305UL17-15 TaxID=3231268 RepID=UPI00345813D1